MASFHAVIPAGGAGTRLWPLSRRGNPKFLLDLTASGRTLLQQTWDRLEPLVGADHVHVVTGRAHADGIRAQLPDLSHVLVEPGPRDSMPAIGLAAAVVERLDPGAVIGSFAADQVIEDVEAFHAGVREAVAVAESGLVCTIGVQPQHPSTAFGYIEPGDDLGVAGAPSGLSVRRFVEKPDAETAARYVADGFLWNAGMFVVRTDVLLGHLQRLQPTMHAGLVEIADRLAAGETEVPEDVWERLTKIAIDHAVAEPVGAEGGVATVPGTFDWDDVGDFAALRALRPAAGDDVLWLDADGIAVPAAGRTISVLGLSDVVVVDTDDALLVTTTEHAQRVKQLPAAWAERGRDDLG